MTQQQQQPPYGQYGQQQHQPQQQPQQQQYGQQQYGQQQFAQQQQSQYQQPNQQQQLPPPTRIEMGAVSSTNDMNAFFSEVTSIQNDIAIVERNITQIEELHNISLNSVSSEDQAVHITRQLDQITQDTTQLSNRIKKRIKGRVGCTSNEDMATALSNRLEMLIPAEFCILDIELANLRLRNSPDIQIRNTQAGTLKEKFMNTLRRFQSSESEARKRYKERMERQIKIVKPEATQAEVRQIVESDNQQIFAQSVLQSTRYGDANRALREVQTRHDDIKKIEKTVLELHQLFMDMETLVTDQGVVMNTIEENTQQTDTQLESGNQQVETAISSARGARKKKWICLIISIILLIIIVVIVLKTTNVI
ncbi:Plasma membrane t-SNARE, secretory vesicle fusion [Mortierella alpina]|uniref:Plasma membrane t-SNARE, secretory vesicle fusion n=1 Tax=Mortierella alpina TaxID=64518 RepID=A0A9P6J544_MORAP|nr:Plasma membrane t-SNARE, secretory vesicle fusion [Mortierella alpina]